MDKYSKKGLEEKARDYINNLTKPVRSLGMLEEIAIKMATITGLVRPELLKKKRVYVFVGDHGVVEEGVSAYPKEVTTQMVYNFLKEGAAINVFARHANAEVLVVDAGVDHDFKYAKGLINMKIAKGTRNFTKGPAISYQEARLSIEYGKDLAFQAKRDLVDLVVVGDMGIANTTTATAVATAFGFNLDDLLDIGTVINHEGLRRKKEAILKGLEINKPDPDDPIDVLSKMGSYCFGEIAGFISGLAQLKIPVVLDGFPTTAAALIAWKINSDITDLLFAGHLSSVRGHQILLKAMGLKPILNLEMRLGEGTGGILATFIIEAAIKMVREMASFESAQVSRGVERFDQ